MSKCDVTKISETYSINNKTSPSNADYIVGVDAVTGDNIAIEIGNFPGGATLYFTSIEAGNAYFLANPAEFVVNMLATVDTSQGEVINGTYLLQTQTGNAVLTEADLNTIHLCTAAAQLTLPEITASMVGKWVRLK
ncbi:unnamed protein product, partial [marine sediment metagenome]